MKEGKYTAKLSGPSWPNGGPSIKIEYAVYDPEKWARTFGDGLPGDMITVLNEFGSPEFTYHRSEKSPKRTWSMRRILHPYPIKLPHSWIQRAEDVRSILKRDVAIYNKWGFYREIFEIGLAAMIKKAREKAVENSNTGYHREEPIAQQLPAVEPEFRIINFESRRKMV